MTKHTYGSRITNTLRKMKIGDSFWCPATTYAQSSLQARCQSTGARVTVRNEKRGDAEGSRVWLDSPPHKVKAAPAYTIDKFVPIPARWIRNRNGKK